MTGVLILTRLDEMGFRVVFTLLSVFWQSSILLIAAGILAYILRNRSVAVRHAVWVAAVLAIPLLPLVSIGTATLGTPRAEIAIIPPYVTPRPAIAPSVTAQPTVFAEKPDKAAPVAMKQSRTAIPASSTSAPGPSIFSYFWALGLTVYLFFISALFLWVLAGQLRIRRWLKDGVAVMDSRVLDAFRQAGERLGIHDEIPLMEHPGVPAPLTCRIRRPVIMLPEGFAEGLSDTELRAVALHETAHVKRRDTLVLSLISFIRAIFFFQPLAWYAARRVSYLAEVSCDAAALEHEGDPAAYAELLTRIAFRLPDRALSTEMAAGILFSNSTFFHRVREILSDRSGQMRKLTRRGLAFALLFGAMSLALAFSFPLGYAGEVNDQGVKSKKPGNWLECTFVDDAGNPIKDVYFTVQWFEPGAKRSKLISKKSDRNGRVLLEGIPFRLVRHGFAWWKGKRQSYTFSFFETNTSHTVVLRAPAGYVAGRVIDESGKPVKRAVVSSDEPNIGPTGVTNGVGTDGKGRFRLPITEGRPHTIRVHHNERGAGSIDSIPFSAGEVTIVLKKDAGPREFTPEQQRMYDYMKRVSSRAQAGSVAPEIAVSTWAYGTPATLADMRGKNVALIFWQGENWESLRLSSLFGHLEKTYRGRNVEFVVIHPYTTDIDAVRAHAAGWAEIVRLAVDGKSAIPEARGKTYDRYGISRDSVFPMIVIVNSEGGITSRGASGTFSCPGEPFWVERELNALMKENI